MKNIGNKSIGVVARWKQLTTSKKKIERTCKKIKYIIQIKVFILQTAKEDLLNSQEHHQYLDDGLNDIWQAGFLFLKILIISFLYVFFVCVLTISPH